MELIGIRIAATIGDNCARVAKYIPPILYKIDNIKMAIIIFLPFKEKTIK